MTSSDRTDEAVVTGGAGTSAADSAGRDTDLGPATSAHGYPHRLRDADAGTVAGNELYCTQWT